MTIMNLLISALSQGMIYVPMALGVFIAFRVLNMPDLTIDGSFVVGMCVCAVVTIAGHPGLALLCGALAGALAGLCTGILQTKLRINPILSGILTMTGLYTINFMVLGGQSNLYLQKTALNSAGVETQVACDTLYKSFRAFLADVTGNKRLDANLSAVLLTGVIVIAVLSVLAYYLCYAWTKERVQVTPTPRKKGQTKKVIAILLKSRPFMAVSLASMLFLAAQMFGQGYNTYLFDHYFHKTGLTMLPTVFQYLPVAVIMFFATRLGNRFGRREVCAYGILLAAVFYLALFVLALFGISSVWLYLAACLASGVGTAFIFLLVWAMTTDAIDYNKVTYGLNDEATSYAFYSFMRKLGTTIATILINVPLLRIGYSGSKLNTEGLTDEALRHMYNSSVMIPAVLFLLVFVILRWFYPLSKQRVAELQTEKEKVLSRQ